MFDLRSLDDFAAGDSDPLFQNRHDLLGSLPSTCSTASNLQLVELREFLDARQGRDVPSEPRAVVVFADQDVFEKKQNAPYVTRRFAPEFPLFSASLYETVADAEPVCSFWFGACGGFAPPSVASGTGNASVMASLKIGRTLATPPAFMMTSPASASVILG